MIDQIIKVKVSAGAKTEKVEETSLNTFKIRVNAPPEKGRANIRVLELLAEYFKIPVSQVFLKSGATSRDKVVLIEQF